MPYLILGVALLAGVLLAGQWFVSAEPKSIARVLKWTLISIVVAAFLFLTVTGRFALAIWAIPALLPWFFRFRQAARTAKNFNRMSGGGARGTSDVSTPFLRMTLDHGSGDIDGEVLKGRHSGRRIGDLSRDELVALYREYLALDAESARLLEAFLDRRYDDWRDEFDDGAANEAPRSSGAMSRDEAYKVLGLAEGASRAEIKEAHHRLIAGLHPDRGGSAYLAAKINEARDLLLKP